MYLHESIKYSLRPCHWHRRSNANQPCSVPTSTPIPVSPSELSHGARSSLDLSRGNVFRCELGIAHDLLCSVWMADNPLSSSCHDINTCVFTQQHSHPSSWAHLCSSDFIWALVKCGERKKIWSLFTVRHFQPPLGQCIRWMKGQNKGRFLRLRFEFSRPRNLGPTKQHKCRLFLAHFCLLRRCFGCVRAKLEFLPLPDPVHLFRYEQDRAGQSLF